MCSINITLGLALTQTDIGPGIIKLKQVLLTTITWPTRVLSSEERLLHLWF
jgi:hypothetical protein